MSHRDREPADALGHHPSPALRAPERPPLPAGRSPLETLLTPAIALALQRDAGNAAVVQRAMRFPVASSSSRTTSASSSSSSSSSSAAATAERPTRLAVQQGPSCWAYVLEAICGAYNVPVTAFSLALRAFPATEDRDAKAAELAKSGGSSDKRLVGVEMMAASLEAVAGRLAAWEADTNPDHRRGATIAREYVEKMLRQEAGTDRAAEKLQFNDKGRAETAAIRIAFVQAAAKARELARIIQGNDDEEIAKILNSGSSEITHDQAEDDVEQTLVHQQFPCYASIRARYHLPHGAGAAAPASAAAPSPGDFTRRPLSELAPTAHAVLLVRYESGPKVVVYKDPNFGDLELRVTVQQFRAMAGTHRITIRPYFSGGTMNQLRD